MYNNAGNLRPVGRSGGFQSFATPEAGVSAMRNDLLTKVSGKSQAMSNNFGADYTPTIRTLITTYAPPSENDTTSYIQNVSEGSGIHPDQPLTPEDVDKIMPLMIKQEQGPNSGKYLAQNQVADASNTIAPIQSAKETPQTQTFNLKLPDGTTINGVPVGTTKDQIRAKFEPLGYNFDAPAPEKGFFGRTADDMKKVGANIADTVNDYQNDSFLNPNPESPSGPEALLRIAGAEGGGAWNTVGNAIGSGSRYINEAMPETSDTAHRLGQEPIKYIADTALGEAIKRGVGKVKTFAENNPRIAADVGAGVNLIGTPTMLKGGYAAIKGGAEVLAETGTKAVKKISDIIPEKTVPVTSDMAKENARNAFKAADDLGAIAKPQIANEFVSAVNEAKPTLFNGEHRTAEEAKFFNSLSDYNKYRDQPLPLNEIENIDKSLNSKIDKFLGKMGAHTEESAKLVELKNRLRSILDKTTDADLIGGRGAIDAWNVGKLEWGKGAKLREIEKITTRAMLSQTPDTAARTALKNLLLNDKKIRFWTDDEVAFLEKIATTGTLHDLLGWAGSRLNPIIAGATGSMGAVAGTAIGSMAARNLKNRIVAKDLSEFSQVVAGRQGKHKLTDIIKSSKEYKAGEQAKADAIRAKAAVEAAKPKLLPPPEKPMRGEPSAEQIANKQNIMDAQNYSTPMGMGGKVERKLLPAPVITHTNFPIEEKVRDLLKDTKVLDETGKPLKVYHGTKSDFKDFNSNPKATSGGAPVYGHGSYFAADPKVASEFAQRGEGHGGNVRPSYINLKNPYLSDSNEFRVKFSGIGKAEITKKLKEEGYDGIIITRGKNPKDSEYIVFDPKQIISAFEKPNLKTKIKKENL